MIDYSDMPELSLFNYTITNTHISLIKAGDTIIHDGKLKTVCNNNIKRGGFFGDMLFGDCYRIGAQPVQKVNIIKAMTAKGKTA